MLRDLATDQQNRVVSRVWCAIGLKPGEVTSELLEEWREALAELSSEEVDAGIHLWKVRGRTCPADEFAASCKPRQARGKVTPEDMGLTPQFDFDESGMNFLQAYNHLCRSRWGDLPADDPRRGT